MPVTQNARPDRSAAVKDRIRASARSLFTRNGFEATGIRDIAALAEVNPALVIRHFGSKDSLFIETVDPNNSWSNVLDGPLEETGRRVVATLMAQRAKGLRIFGAVVRASGREDIHLALQSSIENQLVAPLAEALGGEDARLRAHLFAAQMTGLMIALAVYDDEFLTTVPAEGVIEQYGDSLQRMLTG